MGYKGLELNGRVAVVIGGTSGLGRAITHALAEAGASVIPTSRRAEQVEIAAQEVEARHCRSLRVVCDVNDRGSLQRLLEASVEVFGKIDILVNSAGHTKRSPSIELDEKDWINILETNLTGTLRACQVFGRHMLERRYGRIINIASLSSMVSLYEVAAYSASKAGVASLTKSLAIEWAPFGVCVNAILPGVFRTPMNENLLDGTPRGQEFLMRTPMKRFGRPEELGGTAVFLASEAASFVTGTIVIVDGGFLASGVNQ
jgi:NAD(P)-dependent dehydrogenase (short-subunit alcohol dehydrogenase family)